MNQPVNTTAPANDPEALCGYIASHHHELLQAIFPEILIHARVAGKVDVGYINGIASLESVTLELISTVKQYLLFEKHMLLPFLCQKVKFPENEISRIGNPELGHFMKNTVARQEAMLNRLDQLKSLTSNYSAPLNASPSAKHLFQGLGEMDNTLREMIRIENTVLFPKAGLVDFQLTAFTTNTPTTFPAMSPILVCTDFSDGSNNAVRYAAEMAGAFQTTLIIFHASHSSVSATDAEGILPADEKARRTEALRRLEESARVIKEQTGIDAETSCSAGLPVDEIINAAHLLKAGTIVTGARETAAGSGIVGGLVYDLMHSSDIPVLAVPMGCAFVPLKRIVLASDLRKGETFDDTMLRKVINRFNGELFLVSVMSPGEKPGVDKAIASFELEHRYSDISKQIELTEGENLVDSLNDFAFEKNADLIVMIPHKHNFLKRMMRNTQTQKVLKGTHRPQLTLIAGNK
jgi:nucleotide-binding universal stress UspA family protein/iron-sulfur cluster repair protein YtfE (RIC family)